MRIGQLAKIGGLTPSPCRFYEASGRIKSVEPEAVQRDDGLNVFVGSSAALGDWLNLRS